MDKTVVHVLVQKSCNHIQTETSNYWGLGDMIRGICGVYEACKRLGYKYILDIANHPISNFFEIFDHPYSELIKSNKDNIRLELFYSQQSLDNFIINNLKDKDYIYFMTHCQLFVYDTAITEDCKNFIKKTLTPKKEFQEFIHTHMPSKPYNIIHYRLGDDGLVRSDHKNINMAYNNIQHHGISGDILISDSLYFKKVIAEKLQDKFKIFNTTLCHIGKSSDINALRDTLFEFILGTQANSIKTYSVYEWISGFINTIGYIYDIPIISINN
jgi:hypothetical protein